MEKKSQFIQDVEAYAKEMAARLPSSKEGGILIIATDKNHVTYTLIATPKQQKTILKQIVKEGDFCI